MDETHLDDVGITQDVADDIEDIVRRHLPAGEGPIGSDRSLAELGLNSVSLLEIVVELEDRFGITLIDEPTDLLGLDTVAAMRGLVSTRVSRP